MKNRVMSDGRVTINSAIRDRNLQDYGRSIVVTQDEFQNALNPNRKVKERMRSSIESRSNQGEYQGFSQEEVSRLRQCFKQFSTSKTIKKPPRSRLNSDGIRQVYQAEPQTITSMSQEELGKLFVSARLNIHGHTLNHIYTQLIKTKGKGISFEDLMQVLSLEPGELDDESDYKKIFETYDKKSRGYFQYEDYRLVGEGVAKYLTENDLRTAFNSIDLKGNGKITYEIFKKVMMNIH